MQHEPTRVVVEREKGGGLGIHAEPLALQACNGNPNLYPMGCPENAWISNQLDYVRWQICDNVTNRTVEPNTNIIATHLFVIRQIACNVTDVNTHVQP